MRNRVILLSLLFLLTAVAMPAEAGARSCDENPDQDRCQNNGNGNGGNIEEYCARHPDSKRCVQAIGEEVCHIIKVHIGTPSLVWDPILGIVEFNPDDCYDVFVYESHRERFQLFYFHYEY